MTEKNQIEMFSSAWDKKLDALESDLVIPTLVTEELLLKALLALLLELVIGDTSGMTKGLDKSEVKVKNWLAIADDLVLEDEVVLEDVMKDLKVIGEEIKWLN